MRGGARKKCVLHRLCAEFFFDQRENGVFFFLRRGNRAAVGVLFGSCDLRCNTGPDVKDPFKQLGKDLTVAEQRCDLKFVRTSDPDDAVRGSQQRCCTQNGPCGDFVPGDFRNVFRPSRPHFVFIDCGTGRQHRRGDVRCCLAQRNSRRDVWLLPRWGG